MDPATVGELSSPLGQAALAAAAEQADPATLRAGRALRDRFSADLAAAALHQEALRRKAVIKFGDRAATLLFTADGLEQASRPSVSRYRADRLVDAGIRTVVDLGCGIGADSLAFAEAGLHVIAVERDETTAEIARANLAGRAEVICADATVVGPPLAERPDTAVFCDPARRTASGRVWNLDQFSPSWTFVASLLAAGSPQLVVAKLGPGLPHAAIPEGVAAEWISDHGDVVEVSLWAGTGIAADSRLATLLPDRLQLVSTARPPSLEISSPLRYLYEPDGAVIRAGAIAQLGRQLGATLLASQIAYLTADHYTPTPFATAFAILEVLPYREKALRAWIRDRDIGRLEIKKRGIDVDPAILRRRLHPVGANEATVVLTRTQAGARALVVERL